MTFFSFFILTKLGDFKSKCKQFAQINISILQYICTAKIWHEFGYSKK